MERPIDPRTIKRDCKAPNGPFEFGYPGQSYIVESDNIYGLAGAVGGRNILYVIAPRNLAVIQQRVLDISGGLIYDRSSGDPNVLGTLELAIGSIKGRSRIYVGNDLITCDWSDNYGFGIFITGVTDISVIPLRRDQPLKPEIQRRRVQRVID